MDLDTRIERVTQFNERSVRRSRYAIGSIDIRRFENITRFRGVFIEFERMGRGGGIDGLRSTCR
jgi:hypothetical protein